MQATRTIRTPNPTRADAAHRAQMARPGQRSSAVRPLLGQCELVLFRDLPPPVIEHVGSYMKTRRVARGTTIFAKGDPGTGLMGVLAGTVKVSVATANIKINMRKLLHEVQGFGEIALLICARRTADVMAMS